MSFRRKVYDGSGSRGDFSSSEWGDPIPDKNKVDKFTSSKRTNKINERLNSSKELLTEDSDKDRYLITYADLITLLLGLFIILYAISNIDSKKYEEIIGTMGDIFGAEKKLIRVTVPQIQFDQKVNLIKSLREELKDIMGKTDYQNSISLEENERGLTIRLLDNILFSSGQSNLSPGSYDLLHEIAVILKQLNNDIRIEGHTDNIPVNSTAFKSNWHLSVERATNTAFYLMNNENVPPDRVSIVGYSEFKPISANDTPEGRAQNRRVDIVILNN